MERSVYDVEAHLGPTTYMLRCWSRADTLSRRTCTHSRFFRSHAKKLDFLTRKIQLVLKVRTSQTLTKMYLSSGLVFVCLCLHVVFGQFGKCIF